MSKYSEWTGQYVKHCYLALIDGQEVACWPNAGLMCACDGTGRHWTPEDKIQVRRCTVEEHIAASKNQLSGATLVRKPRDRKRQTQRRGKR